MKLETSSSITCKGPALNINMNMKLDGEVLGYASISVEKVGNQLIIDSKGLDGGNEYTEREICE